MYFYGFNMAMAEPSKSRTIYLLYTVGFLDLLGVSMIIPMLGLHARDIGASPAVIGILGSMYGFLQLISSPVLGDWSDRAGRRIVLIYSLLFAALGYFILGTANSVIMLFLARIPSGIFKHSQELSIGYLGSVLPKSQHALVFGRFHAASSLGFIIGPLLSGHLADLSGGYHLVAMATSAFFLADAGLFKQTQSIVKVALADKVAKEFHSMVFGWYNSISTLGFVVGPVLGGHIADLTYGRRLVFIAAGAVFVLNAAVVWLFIPMDTPHRKCSNQGKPSSVSSKSIVHQLSLFVNNLRQMDWTNLWDIFFVRFLLGFATIIFRTNFSLSLDTRFDVSGKQIGYIISYVSVVSAVAGLFVGRLSRWYSDDRRLLLHVSILQSLSIGLSTMAPSLALLVVAMAPLSVANAVARVCVTNLTIARVKEGETGAVLGYGASVLSTARIISPLLGGLVFSVHEKGPGLLGLISALSGVIVIAFTEDMCAEVSDDKYMYKYKLS